MTDVGRERIPLLWSTVNEGPLANGYVRSSMRGAKYLCVFAEERSCLEGFGFNVALCPQIPQGLLGTIIIPAQDGHHDFHTAPEL